MKFYSPPLCLLCSRNLWREIFKKLEQLKQISYLHSGRLQGQIRARLLVVWVNWPLGYLPICTQLGLDRWMLNDCSLTVFVSENHKSPDFTKQLTSLRRHNHKPRRTAHPNDDQHFRWIMYEICSTRFEKTNSTSWTVSLCVSGTVCSPSVCLIFLYNYFL